MFNDLNHPSIPIAMVVPNTRAEGPGKRLALWVQGCPFRCKGCCNPEFLDESTTRVKRSVNDMISAAKTSLEEYQIEGVSFLGGEPFLHAENLGAVAKGVQALGLSVMIFSGYTLGELEREDAPKGAKLLLAHCDLLVDGRFVQSKRERKRRYIGSSNQKLHFLSTRYSNEHPDFSAPNTLEIRFEKGALSMNGFPLLKELL